MKKVIITLLFVVATTCNYSLFAQGPVIISGLDTEWGIRPGNNSHGTIAMWSSVIQTGILNNVTLNPTGPILVIGGGKDISGGPTSPPDEMTAFWDDIGLSLGKTIVYSNSFSGNILTINIIGGGWSMIAICNTADGQGRLTLTELNDISSRQAEIASFVNSGGGLFASSCNIGTPPYGYINIGSPSLVSVPIGGSVSTPTPGGIAMGIPSISGPFHNHFTQWPSFLSILSTVNVTGKPNAVCILGGAKVTIPVDSKFCCPGKNLVVNGDFEGGNTGFTSQYNYNSSTTSNATIPGQYNIVNGAGALSISSGWIAQDPLSCSNASGKFLVVNGKTCGTGQKVIWEQNFTVTDWSKYMFCASAKNLNQCNFNIKPNLEIQFSMSGIGNVSQTLNVSSGACDWFNFSKHVDLWGYGTVLNIKILLDETGCGDGNDLALDNIALIEIPLMPDPLVAFGMTNPAVNDLGGGFFGLTATSVPLPATYKKCGVYWEIVQQNISSPFAEIPGTKVSNPSQWWSLSTYVTSLNFPGYDGNAISTTLFPFTTFPVGRFKWDGRYKLSRAVYCDCYGWNQQAWIYSPDGQGFKIIDEKTKKIIMTGNKPKRK